MCSRPLEWVKNDHFCIGGVCFRSRGMHIPYCGFSFPNFENWTPFFVGEKVSSVRSYCHGEGIERGKGIPFSGRDLQGHSFGSLGNLYDEFYGLQYSSRRSMRKVTVFTGSAQPTLTTLDSFCQVNVPPNWSVRIAGISAANAPMQIPSGVFWAILHSSPG